MEELVLNSAMALATMWIVDRYWQVFFEKKEKNIPLLLSWIAFALFQLFMEWNSNTIYASATIINVLLFLMIAVNGYESRGKEKYFLLIIFYAVWSLIEILVFFFMGNLPIAQERSDKIGVVISKIIAMLSIHILSLVWNKRDYSIIPFKYYVFLLLIPLGSIYIAIAEFYEKGSYLSAMIIISLLLLFNIVILEMYSKLNEIFMVEKEKAVYAKQLEIVSKNTSEQKRIMEEFYEEKHNLINELAALRSGIENDEKEKVLKNLNQIIHNCHDIKHISNSGNSTIDAIINFKYAIAAEAGIKLLTKMFVPHKLPIEQCDMGVILGNALDNAIEAVKACEAVDKRIDISIGYKREALIIVVKNPYVGNLEMDYEGHLLSSKKDKDKHGYGLKSIKRIAEKYQGEIVIETEEQVFSLTIVMNLGGI